MANVVLCSEQGRGKRYLSQLADCVVGLQAQGHAVRLVCRDLATANAIEEFAKVSIFPSPPLDRHRLNRASQPAQRPKNYSSTLMSNGFSSAEELVPRLRSWLHILATLDADRVIAYSSPTALLAAKLLQVPCVMLGTGFTVPPVEAPLPSVTPWRTSTVGEAATAKLLVAEDQRLLNIVNQAISMLSFDKFHLNSAHEIFSHSRQWIATLPEMDPYGSREASYVVRWAAKEHSVSPSWPSGPGDKVFVYMEADSPHLVPLLDQLRKIGDPVLAVVPKASEAFIEQHRGDNIQIQNQHVDIRRVAEQCKVFINNCGHDLIYELLMIGVPSVFLPYKPANTMLAYRLSKMRVGFPGPSNPAKLNVEKLLEAAKQKDQIWHNASGVSIKHQNHKSLKRMHDLIVDEFRRDSRSH